MKYSLEQLGNRICIIGPSSSGKSTLAQSLSKKLLRTCFHLDQYAHFTNSEWVRKDNDTFKIEHQKIIERDEWIIEGNYSVCMPERFSKATAVIWVDSPLISSMIRYLTRTLSDKNNRHGQLQGAKDKFNFSLIKHTFMKYPKARVKYNNILNEFPNLKILRIKNMRELNKYYKYWDVLKI